jgi:hypothetical protein
MFLIRSLVPERDRNIGYRHHILHNTIVWLIVIQFVVGYDQGCVELLVDFIYTKQICDLSAGCDGGGSVHYTKCPVSHVAGWGPLVPHLCCCSLSLVRPGRFAAGCTGGL